jgi:glutathione peroxidase
MSHFHQTLQLGLHFSFWGLILTTFTSCMGGKTVKERPATNQSTTKTEQMATAFYQFNLPALDGTPISFEQYKGKKVLLINVASKCGYTPQYADWEAFHKAHGDKVVVLGFPANNFMKQEPGSNAEIAEFCTKNYGVSFQMFEKIDVVGEHQHPLYQWLSDESKNGWNSQVPSWNFCKYLIDEHGNLTHFFASGVKPQDSEFLQAVGL